ncbi:MAG: metalloregulator ArsR/SmtB family transcription factor [Minwuiales bacterium]|nr:metalloregulator ArsR/SmtB family transcription factor [Minwuiales bacterium]
MAIQYKTPLDHTFHALGDETRRQILSMLATEGPRSANELHAPFDVAQPTISKHLKVLERAGLVTREVEGRIHRFRLEMAPMKEAEDWIARHEAFWKGTLKRLDDYLTGTGEPEEKS